MTELKTEKRSDYRKFLPHVLKGNFEFNSRVEYGEISELANSIRENGVLQPLKGYRCPENKNEVVITDGFRRLKAIQILQEEGWTEYVPVTIVKLKDYPKTSQLLDQYLMNSGKSLTPFEEGELYKRLIGENMTQQEIATKTGRTQGHISHVLAIANAPEEITSKIVEGIISPSLAFQIIKSTTDSVKQIEMVNDAISTSSNGKKKVTSKNFKTLSKSPLKTLELALEELSSNEEKETIQKVYNLLKKKVTVDEFVSSFKQ